MVRKALLIGFALSVAIAGGYRISTEEFKGWNHIKSMVIYSKKHPLYNPFVKDSMILRLRA